MITVLITENEQKIRELLLQVAGKEGVTFYRESPSGEGLPRGENLAELDSALFDGKKGMLYKAIVETTEKRLIEHVLKKTEGNQLKAARILGINRNTIRTKIRRLGINLSLWKTAQ